MEPFIGEIMMFAGNFAPRGWAFCNGQLLPINQNTALFSILGTTYGGDGRTTFALPDLRGRLAMHEGQGPGLSSRPLGSKGGTESNTLTTTQMPSHNHVAQVSIPISGDDATTDEAGGLLATTDGAKVYGGSASGTYSGSPINAVVGNTGSNSPINNMQPYLCVNYVIALVGIFPSRS